jgi:hypothetical protein
VGLLLCRDGGVTAAVSPSPSTAAAGVGVASYWAATTSEESGGGRSGLDEAEGRGSIWAGLARQASREGIEWLGVAQGGEMRTSRENLICGAPI